MGKRNKGNQRNNGPTGGAPFKSNETGQTKEERAKALLLAMNEKKQQELMKDERIQQKLDELTVKEIELETKYEEKQKELSDWEKSLHLQEQQLDELKATMIAEIRSDEDRLRSEHRQRLERQLAETKRLAEQEIEEMLATAKKERLFLVEEAGQQAHSIVIQSEEEALRLIAEARSRAQKAFSEMEQELTIRNEQLSQKEKEAKRKEKELNALSEDLIYERTLHQAELKRLEEKYEAYSPGRIRELEFELSTAQQLLAIDKEQINRLQQEIVKLRSFLPGQMDRTFESLQDELLGLREYVCQLEDKLADLPSEATVGMLRTRAKEAEQAEEENRQLRAQLQEIRLRAGRLETDHLALTQAKLETEALRALNVELSNVLKEQKELYESNTSERFKGLCDIDRSAEGTAAVLRKRIAGITLPKLIDYVQAFGVQEKQLYYSANVIRKFVAGLASTKLMILQGLSGTGKSSLPQMFTEAISGHCELIPVQPSWRDRNELLGFDNDFTKKFKETPFTKAIYRAGMPSERSTPWIVVLDEMNLARIEYYFADFLAVLEKKNTQEWRIPLVSYDTRMEFGGGPKWLVDGSDLLLSGNVWFIGTANRDESTFEITDKVYDRAQVLEFGERQQPFTVQSKIDKFVIGYEQLNELFDEAISRREFHITDNEWSAVDQLDHFLNESFGITFGNRIKMQMEAFVPVFVASGGSKGDAVDHQFASKVLRKLEGRHDAHLLSELKELREIMQRLFPGWSFEDSQRIIGHKIRALGG